MPTDGERIATLEERIANVIADVAALGEEDVRTRKRLHDLEGLTGVLVEVNKQAQATAAKRQRRLELQIQILTVVVAAAAFALSLTIALVHHS